MSIAWEVIQTLLIALALWGGYHHSKAIGAMLEMWENIARLVLPNGPMPIEENGKEDTGPEAG